MHLKPKPPMPGGEHVQFVDTGPQDVSANATRVELIPVGDGDPGPLLPRMYRRKKQKPLLPRAAEIAKLPKGARIAYYARCVERVKPILEHDRWSFPVELQSAASWDVTAQSAAIILSNTSDLGELRFIRRDFERLARLARANAWTDDTPVPPEVFGPLWPGRVPRWARPKKEPQA